MTLRKLFVGGVLAVCVSGCVTALGGGVGAWIGHQRDEPARRAEPTIGAAVAVRFAVPREITVSGGGAGDARRVLPATTVLGRIVAAHGDTLSIELAEISGERGRERFTGRYSITVVRDSTTSVQLLNRHPGRTTGIVLGMIIGFIGDIVLFLYLTQGS